MDEQVVLTISREKAQAISAALDVYVQLRMGRLEILGEMVREGAIGPVKPQDSDPVHSAIPSCDYIDALLTAAKGELDLPDQGMLDIDAPALPSSIKSAHQTKLLIDQKLALDGHPVFEEGSPVPCAGRPDVGRAQRSRPR